MTLLIPETPQERELVGRFYQEYGRQLLEGVLQAPSAETPGEQPGDPYAGEQGEHNLRRLLSELQDNARHALRAIADDTLDGPTPPNSDTVRERLGMEPGENKLGGMLTSIGFAIKRTHLPRPYEQRWSGDRQTYVMTREVAEMIRELLDKDGSLK